MSREVPEGWNTATVADVAEILDSRRIPLNSGERQERRGAIPYWGANGIVDHIDGYLFDEPLVLMAEDGGYFDEAATRPICHRLDGKAWVNNHAHVIRATGVERDWFYYWFVHRDITPHIKGGTRSKLNQKDLKQLPILVPPLAEQRRIAEILSSVDEAIQTSQAVIEQTRASVTALRETLLSKGIYQTRLVGTIIGNLPASWSVAKVGDVIRSMDSGWSPDCETEAAGDGQWGVLKTSAVVWDGYNSAENKRLPPHLEARAAIEVMAGDVLVTRAGPVERTGVVAFVRESRPRLMLSDKIIRLQSDNAKCDPAFLALALSSTTIQEQIIRKKSGMALSQTNISQKGLRETLLPLPSLHEQRAIIDIITSITDAIRGEEANLATKHVLKNALMSDLLTGRKRVTSDLPLAAE